MFSNAEMERLSCNWAFPTAIRFGVGRVAELGRACKLAGISRALFVIDQRLATQPIATQLLDIAEDAHLGRDVFCDFDPNPTDRNLEAGLAVFRDGEFDGIVAFGGGSALDLGKLIAFQAGQNRSVFDFEDRDANWRRADAAAMFPVVAVPTTAGTGSEVGRVGVLTDTRRQTKAVIYHPDMIPKAVICDPGLTVGLPAALTAGTGFDALSHCLEAYCAPQFHPMCDGIAIEGLRLVATALPAAYHNGADLGARAHMMAAALMGAVAFQKGLGAIPALSHPTGALYDTHHGRTNAVFLPYVLAFNRPAVEEKLDHLAGWLGIAGGAYGFLDFVLTLRAELEIEHTLAALGVDDVWFDRIAVLAEADPTAAGNPIPLDASTCRNLLQRAYSGAL